MDFYLVNVLQRNKKYGCIPTSVEWLLKYSKTEVRWKNDDQKIWDLKFQEELIKKIILKGKLPNFEIVKNVFDNLFEIQGKKLITKAFTNSKERKEHIIKLLIKNNSCLGVTPVTKASEYQYKEFDGLKLRYEAVYEAFDFACHIMPIVGYNDETITFLDIAQEPKTLKPFYWNQLLEIQDKYILNDLLWLESL